MTREDEKQEKARELAIKYCKEVDPHGKEVYNIGCAIACCEMADWTDQHPRKGLWDAEKVIKWLRTNIDNYANYNVKTNKCFVNDFEEDLTKAMEDKIMAHTIDDLVIEIADKYSKSTVEYSKNKEMLWKIVEQLHHPIYLEKLSKDNYKNI